MTSSKRLIVIAGPTAVGKTEVAIRLAEELKTSIISADSRQCYRELNIGVARPSKAQLARVPHYFIDQFPVTEDVSAAGFERLALGWLKEIFAQHDTAILCGGTGLYIKALCEGLDEMPAVDAALKAALDADYSERGLIWLQETTLKEDPGFWHSGADTSNPARMLRALAFKRSTGMSITGFQKKEQKQRPFSITKICLSLPREMLYQRINKRVVEMINAGLVDEATLLYPRRNLKSLNTVGYMELFDFLEGKTDLQQAVYNIKQHTRNYAKRQLTWFRNAGTFTELDALEAATSAVLRLF